jgi:hypothetical protein
VETKPGATVVVSSRGDRVVVSGRSDRVECVGNSFHDVIYARRTDRAGASCARHHDTMLQVDDCHPLEQALRVTQATITGTARTGSLHGAVQGPRRMSAS